MPELARTIRVGALPLLCLAAAAAATPTPHYQASLRHAGGEWLLHWNSKRDGNYEIYRQEADGRETNISQRASNEWLWSAHHGRRIALSNEKSEAEAKGWRGVLLDGDRMQRISPDPTGDGFIDCHPAGAPCLVDVYVERKRHIAVLDGQGKRLRLLDQGEQESADPQFSPDGKRLLFRSNRGGSWELWLGDADGANARPLTRDAGNDRLVAHEYGGEGPARFSPDGRRIVWMRKFPGRGYDIWTMRVDGSGARNLTADHAGDDAYPSFSPDGRLIAFDSNRSGDNEIHVMAANGGRVRRVTFSKGADLAPIWVRTP